MTLITQYYDAPEHYQIGFQDSASSLAEEIQ
jgi:hypothetical protein